MRLKKVKVPNLKMFEYPRSLTVSGARKFQFEFFFPSASALVPISWQFILAISLLDFGSNFQI